MAIFHGIVNLLPTTALPTTTSPVVAVSHDVHCTLRSSRKKSPRTTALALYDGQNLKISNHCRQALTLKAYRLKSIVLAFFFLVNAQKFVSYCVWVPGNEFCKAFLAWAIAGAVSRAKRAHEKWPVWRQCFFVFALGGAVKITANPPAS